MESQDVQVKVCQPPQTKQAGEPRQASVPEPQPQEVELRRIDRKHLMLGKEIGQGEFGSVVKGVYKKQHHGRKKEKIDVAVKLFMKTASNNQEDFLNGARTMQQLQHEFIVNFIGIVETDTHELLLVEEYLSMGPMLDYLIENQSSITLKDLYLWAAEIACGMTYMEEQKMVHRDLAARNILLQSKSCVKISGLSRAVHSNSDYNKTTTRTRWPIRWMAPECVNYECVKSYEFSHASDVWSFGVTLWEMFTFGKPPYGDMNAREVTKFIEEGKRLEKPAGCTDVLYNQMCKCWDKDPKKRPSFRELNDTLQLG